MDAASGFGRLVKIGWEQARQERSSRWTTAQLRRRQAEALARLRRFAAEHSPFYRAFHRGLDGQSLEDLPILDKATLMAEFDRVVTDPAIRLAGVEQHLAQSSPQGLYLGRYTALSTSGSTGLRGVFLFDAREWIVALAAITRPLRWAEAPPPWRRPRAALIPPASSNGQWHSSFERPR